MIRVAIVDDQSLVRVGLRVLLEAEDDIEVVGDAADGRAAVELVRGFHPDVVLLDVRMAGGDGIEALRRITSDAGLATTRVIMLTTFEHDEYIFESLRCGASGFLTKDTEPTDILNAVRVVARGDSLLSPAVTRRVIGEFAARPSAQRTDPTVVGVLTDRERQVVALVAQGLSNEEIAQRLVVSPATARTHVSRAMVKLRARDRAQLVVLAYQSGLATVDGA
jgi:DNA-binding NarL/FixJ family response regulator